MSNKKSQKIFYENLNNHLDRHPATIKEIKFFGTANSFDEHSTPTTIDKCSSPKFLRTQSFGILSPKSQIKFFGNAKNRNSNTKDYNAVSDSNERLYSRSVSSSKTTLTQVREIFEESCDYDVAESRGLERLKRLRNRFRKSSFSVESNTNGYGSSER